MKLLRGTALLTGTLLLASPAAPALGEEPIAPESGLRFELLDLDGESHSSEDSLFTGNVVYVTAWGTWCPPCLSEIPFLQALHDEYASAGLRVVAIAFERESDGQKRREQLQVFCEQEGISYLVLDGGTTKDFEQALPGVDHVKGLPVEFLIDRGGNTVLARNSYGYKESWAEDLGERIQALLALSD